MANIANDNQNSDSRLLSVRWNIPDSSSRFDDLPTSASVFIEWGSAQQKRCMQGYVTRDVCSCCTAENSKHWRWVMKKRTHSKRQVFHSF